MLIETGVANGVVARGKNLGEKVLSDIAVAAITRDFIHTRRADDFGYVRVCMQALQLVAAFRERIKKAGLLEEVRRVEVAILLGQRGKIDEDFVHAAVLGAQHALPLVDAEAAHEPLRPLGHALGHLQGVRIAGLEIHVNQARHDLVIGVKGSPDGFALRQVFEELGGKALR